MKQQPRRAQPQIELIVIEVYFTFGDVDQVMKRCSLRSESARKEPCGLAHRRCGTVARERRPQEREHAVGMGAVILGAQQLVSGYSAELAPVRRASLLPALQARNETTGPIFKMRNDPRCTRVGRYIRRWSLDEVPQLLNVVLGDMSLVGPRPPLSHEVERYEPWQLRRLEAKPGLTGLWQVSGRSNLVFDEMVMMDIYYVDRWSLMLDAQILIRTVITVLTRHGAF